jgi:hypothetical protein
MHRRTTTPTSIRRARPAKALSLGALRAFGVIAVMGLGFVVTGSGCTSGPRSANCTNDGQCADSDEGRAYCVNSRCVECVTNAACGPHKRCAAGSCVPRGS